MIIRETSFFKKDFKKYYRDLKVKTILTDVLEKIVKKQELPASYRNHTLNGKYKNFNECHLLPDLLLIYRINDDEIILTRLGSHSDLF